MPHLLQTLLYKVVLSTPRHEQVQTYNFSGDGTGNCKSNYHMITTMTALIRQIKKRFPDLKKYLLAVSVTSLKALFPS